MDARESTTKSDDGHVETLWGMLQPNNTSLTVHETA